MNKIVPDPPREMFERALRHYLKPDTQPPFSAHQDLSFEDALVQICDLLRCAAATAAGTTQTLLGHERHLAGATEHLINNAKTLADRALECLHGT